jgi:hypothetical protein
MIFYNGFNLLVDLILVGVAVFVTYGVTKYRYYSTKRDSFIPPF